MASIGTIFTYDSNPRVFKALIAAKYNGVQVEVTKDFEFGVTNKTPEFLKKFPLGKVPAFDSVDGPIYESNAIAYYVASQKDTGLLGKNAYETALVHQYINFVDNEITPSIATWLYPIFGYIPYNKANTDRAKEDIKKTLAALDNILLDKTYLVGNSVTLADISVFCGLLNAYQQLFDATFRAPFINVNRWFTTIANQPNVKAVVGEVVLATTMAVYDAKKLQKEEKPKEEKPKEEKPKEEKKKAPKKKDDDEEEEENYEDEAPKGKNPLDLLPPSKFNLEEWKRFYSNNDTRPTAANWFFENFDAEGFSIWRVNYRYNSELTLTFMSNNLIGGFFQRLEKARKYAFGSLIVTGTDNNNEISGYFVFRGAEVPFEVTDVPDYPSYEFIKVNDINDAAFRETFVDYLAWDGKLEGKTFTCGKVYK